MNQPHSGNNAGWMQKIIPYFLIVVTVGSLTGHPVSAATPITLTNPKVTSRENVATDTLDAIVTHVIKPYMVDVSSMDSIISTITRAGMSARDKAVAVHSFIWYFGYYSVFPHECISSNNWCECYSDVIKTMNMYPWGECGYYQALMAQLFLAAGIPVRTTVINNNSHWVVEANFDGGWHFFDSGWGKYYCNPDGTIASLDQIMAAPNHSLPACPGPGSFGGTGPYSITEWHILSSSPSRYSNPHSMQMDLKRGDEYILSNEADGIWFTPPNLASSAISMTQTRMRGSGAGSSWTISNGPTVLSGGPSTDWNFPAYTNSKFNYTPNFRSGTYVDRATAEQNTKSFAADGVEPNLHAATAGQPSSVTFSVTSPLVIIKATLDGTFIRTNSADSNKVSVSANNGSSWTTVWTMGTTGSTTVSNVDFSSAVYGKYSYLIRFEYTAASRNTDAGINTATIRNVFQSSALVVPRLVKGQNIVTATVANPTVLSQGNFSVEYRWKENGVEKTDTFGVTGSPTNRTITCAAEPVMRYVRLFVGDSGSSPTPNQPTATPTGGKTGDSNGDGKVDGLDYVTWLSHFGQAVRGPANGDYNNNGVVDGADYVVWLNNYGK